MKVTIYLKQTPSIPLRYEMDLAEFKRLSQDFQKYLREGQPTSGTYQCRTLHGDKAIKMRIESHLHFDEIVSIG